MQKCWILKSLVFVCLLVVTGCSDDDSSLSKEARLQGVIDQAVTSMHPGYVMSLDGPAGEWNLAAGCSDTLSQMRMTPDTRLRIGSCTKVFTATACMLLVEDGFLDVNATVADYVPQYNIPHDSLITVENLLNMTSGLADYLNDDDWVLSTLAGDLEHQFTKAELIDHATTLTNPDEMDIGGEWSYCNTNYVLLTDIIETKSGMDYAGFIQQRILNPLGMTQTTVATEPANFSHGYVDLNDDGVVDDVMSWNPTYVWGAGCMVSTSRDLAIFARALLCGDLLQDESMGQMESWVEVAPEEFEYGCGLGHYISLELIGHNGAVPGYAAEMWLHGPSSTVVTVISNSNRIDYDHTFTLAQEALEIMTGEEFATGSRILGPACLSSRLVR